MNTIDVYSEIHISEQRIVRFYDRSTVYFGDYHHVRLEARCEFESPEKRLNEHDLPDSPVYTRMLERMAVPSASVEDVKNSLIEDFRKNSLPYLSNPDFSLKMVDRKLPVKAAVARKYPASFG